MSFQTLITASELDHLCRTETDVVILDARDFGADPLATIHLPCRVPFGFHGNWLPDSA